MTQLSEQLIPALENTGAVVAERLGLPGAHAGNIVAVDDPTDALPLGALRRVRGTVADNVGLDVIVVLVEDAAAQVQLLAGAGDDLVGALLPTVNAVIGTIGANTNTPLELADLVEMGTTEPVSRAGTEAFTAGLFLGDEQIGNVIFLAATGAPAPAGPAGAPFPALDADADVNGDTIHQLSLLHGVEMRVTAELGRTRLPVSHVLDLGPGAVVELDRVAGSPVDVLVNGTVIAHGEVVVIDEEYGVRITEIVGAEDDK